MATADALRAMSDRERLAALRAMSPDELDVLQEETRAARQEADRQYGPALRYRPSAEEPPDIDLTD